MTPVSYTPLWALGCRIDGGQAEYVRVPYADRCLDKIPDGVTDLQALLVGDVLATGYWAAQIAEVKEDVYKRQSYLWTGRISEGVAFFSQSSGFFQRRTSAGIFI